MRHPSSSSSSSLAPTLATKPGAMEARNHRLAVDHHGWLLLKATPPCKSRMAFEGRRAADCSRSDESAADGVTERSCGERQSRKKIRKVFDMESLMINLFFLRVFVLLLTSTWWPPRPKQSLNAPS